MAASESAAGSANDAQQRTLSVQVMTPSSEVPGGRITLPDLPVDTTLAQVRDRLSQEIPSSPPPDRQRLIYRGRALVDNSLTVLEIFSLELASAEPPAMFTLHLVLPPPDQLPNRSSSTPQGPTATPNPPESQNIPVHPQEQLLQALQAQMLQQMQHLQHMQQAYQPQLGHTQGHGPLPGTAIGGPFQATPGMGHQPSRVMQVPAGSRSQAGFADATNNSSFPGAANFQNQTAGGITSTLPTPYVHQRHHPLGPAPGQPVPPTDPSQSQGDRQNIPNMSQASMPNAHQPSPYMPRPSHAMAVHEAVGPNGQRYQSVVGQSVHMQQNVRPGSAPPGHSSGVTPPIPQSVLNHGLLNVPPQPPGQGMLPQVHTGQFSFAPMQTVPPLPPLYPMNHFRNVQNPFGIQPQVSGRYSNVSPTAWLLSSPSGPQGFLFSPNHGYFSTSSSAADLNSRAAAMRPFMRGSRLVPRVESPVQRPAAAQDLRDGQPDVAPPIRAALAQQRQRQPQEQQDGDIIRGLLRRAWTFVRFYLLALFFSEYGTWRRWILLGIAFVACILPETNFFRDLGQRMQQHLETLVPLAPRRGQGDQQNQNRGAGTRQNGQADQGQQARRQEPTPEQTAERLRREHQARNQAWWREGLTRIERAIALFVATLFPGVGERHIQARNDAEAERRAEEQRQREAETTNSTEENGESSQAAQSAGTGPISGESAQSSAVEGQHEDGGARQRINNEAGPPLVEI
ncbi:MAG: hypothetical protein Q9227_007404 [Pyrenula ochraceoflavens]